MVGTLYEKKARIVYLQNLIGSLGYNMTTKILPFVLREFTSSALNIGLVNSCYQIGRAFGAVPSGLLGDKVGHRKSLAISYLAISFFALGLSLGISIASFILLFLGIGLSSSMLYLVLTSLATTTRDAEGKALSKLEMTYQIGFVAGPILGGFIASALGMTIVFYTWSALSLVGLLLVCPLKSSGSGSTFAMSKAGSLLLSKVKASPIRFIMFLGSIFTIGLVEGARDLLVPLFALEIGFAIFHVGVIFSLSALITAIGIIPFGSFADRYGDNKTLLLAFFMLSFSLVLIPFSFSLGMLSLMTGILSLGRSLGLVSSRAFVSREFEQVYRTTALAIVELLFLLGRATGPLVSGLLVDITNTSMTLHTIAFTIIVFVLVSFSARHYVKKAS